MGAGRRAEAESAGGSTLRTWPYVAAGICTWDTLAPLQSALVAHDGAADTNPGAMPVEYTCLGWSAGQQRLLCGTKAGELRVFDLRQRRLSHRLDAHGAAVRHCFVLPETGKFVTLSAAAELKVWRLRDLECLETRPRLHSAREGISSVLGKAHALTCAAMLSESHLLTGGHDGALLLTRI